MKKKTTPKPKRKPTHSVEVEEITDGLPPIDYIALTFWGRFAMAGLFIRKAFASLFKGQATV